MMLMKKRTSIDRDQAWFWSKEWQRSEAQVDRDIEAGRVSGPFRSVADFVAHLRFDCQDR